MPYDEPPERIRHLPKHAQEIWMAAYNAAYEQYDGDEAKANAVAWAAVKRQYYQDEDGVWHKRQESARRIITVLAGGTADPPQWIRLLPVGTLELGDGRPPIYVDPEALDDIVDRFRRHGVDLVIDYEHQTLTGDVAPAAGWIKDLEVRDDGLWAQVDWTNRAADYIRAREYRYYSPTVLLDNQRKVVDLINAAITNTPAISRTDALAAKTNINQGDGDMEDKLLTVLELQPGASDDDMVQAVEALKIRAQRAIELEEELAQLRQQMRQDQANALIEEALRTGRTTPAELDRANGRLRQLALEEPEAFRDLILTRQVGSAVPIQPLAQYRTPPTREPQIHPDEWAIAKQFGYTMEQYKQIKEKLVEDNHERN